MAGLVAQVVGILGALVVVVVGIVGALVPGIVGKAVLGTGGTLALGIVGARIVGAHRNMVGMGLALLVARIGDKAVPDILGIVSRHTARGGKLGEEEEGERGSLGSVVAVVVVGIVVVREALENQTRHSPPPDTNPLLSWRPPQGLWEEEEERGKGAVAAVVGIDIVAQKALGKHPHHHSPAAAVLQTCQEEDLAPSPLLPVVPFQMREGGETVDTTPPLPLPPHHGSLGPSFPLPLSPHHGLRGER